MIWSEDLYQILSMNIQFKVPSLGKVPKAEGVEAYKEIEENWYQILKYQSIYAIIQTCLE